MNQKSIIILAAGQGTRMKSDTPKVLHKISGKPMLYYSIKEALKLSDDITVVLYHQFEKVKTEIEKYFSNINFVIQDHKNYPGTGGAVMGITPKYEKVLVLNGDMPLIQASELEKFDMTRVEVIDWDSLSVDTNLEFGESKDSSKISIQEGLKQYLVDSGSSTHIFYDHGSGEVADFITFNEYVSHININLYHCKSRSGKRFNSNLGDVYEVAQQAVKCTKWLKNKVELQNQIDERNRNTRNSTFIKGDFTSFKELMRVNKPMNVTVYIVQPGVSISKPMKEEYGTILSSANYFIRNSGRVKKLKILGSS